MISRWIRRSHDTSIDNDVVIEAEKTRQFLIQQRDASMKEALAIWLARKRLEETGNYLADIAGNRKMTTNGRTYR